MGIYLMYVRDRRSPTPKSETVSRVMSANRAKNTSPELLLRQLLYHSGHRGYRLHRSIRFPSWIGGVAEGRGGRKLSGSFSSVRPDIAFISCKVAIFVMGCFWH